MIDIHSEHMLTIAEAARELPGRPHVSTLWRWIQRGCRGVRLEAILIGGIRYTSRESLQRFCDSITAAADGLPASPRTPKQRERQIAQSEAELASHGI
jgi:hypothetical protein